MLPTRLGPAMTDGDAHIGLSPASHKINAGTEIMYQCRSGRVRRQGLEPRTRGLRLGSPNKALPREDVLPG